ncbi:DUF2812 domain-containing protein [Amedibacillus sp. YH-ame10]
MKTKRKTLNFFLYEHQALQEYLENMAEEGWMIERISGGLMKILTFVSCTPKKYYFHLDFISNYSFWFPQVENKEVFKYRALVEEYGYTFILNQGPLQLFMSEEKMDIPIREQSAETKKELRKISIKEVGMWMIFGILWIFMGISSFLNGKYQDAYVWADNATLVLDVSRCVLGLLYISFSFPVFAWIIHEKKRYSLWRIQLRTYLQYVSVLCIIVLMLGGLFNLSFALILLYIILAVSIINMSITYTAKRFDKTYKRIAIIALLVVGMIMGGNKLIEKSVQNSMLNNSEYILTEGKSVIPYDYLEWEENQTVDIRTQNSEFLKEVDYSYSENEDEYFSYQIVTVKNTPLHKLIMQLLTTKDLISEREIGKYKVYVQEYYVLVRDQGTYISFSADQYKEFSSLQLDYIFDQIDAM